MKIKQHIINYLTYIFNNGIEIFKTSDIQNLSERSAKFAKRGRLGSPSTYERTFRQLRQDGKITVQKQRLKKGGRQSSWKIKEIRND